MICEVRSFYRLYDKGGGIVPRRKEKEVEKPKKCKVDDGLVLFCVLLASQARNRRSLINRLLKRIFEEKEKPPATSVRMPKDRRRKK